MIDFHCHIDLYPDPSAVIEGVSERGTYVLAVTTTPKAWRGTKKVIGSHKRIRIAVGLHPELIRQRHHEVALLCGLLPETKYVGEIGIDGSPPHRDCLDLQISVFDRILTECSRQGGKIMTIHSRGAASLVLDSLERHPGAGTPVLHWFSGTRRELDRATALGCWFSVGPAMLRTSKGQALAAQMPLQRLLTETDGPFGRTGNLPLMPWQAFDCLDDLASITGKTGNDLKNAVLENFQRLVTASGLDHSAKLQDDR